MPEGLIPIAFGCIGRAIGRVDRRVDAVKSSAQLEIESTRDCMLGIPSTSYQPYMLDGYEGFLIRLYDLLCDMRYLAPRNVA
jgi:hypothetical protein